MRSADVDVLRHSPLFSDMTESNFQRLIQPSFVQSFPQRTKLLVEDEPADFLYVVLDGLVLMSARSADSETVLEILRTADIFILAAVLNDDVCLQSAQTLTPSRMLMIPASLVRRLMSEDVSFMRAVVFETARAYRRLVKELKTQKLRSGVQRLANWIMKESLVNGGSDIVVIPYEKRTLAAYLGMTPENLSRSFAALASHGVDVQASVVKIADREKLQNFAAPSHLIDGAEPTSLT